MRHFGEALRDADVEAVYLVHGTFAGVDPHGWIGELSRVAPWTRAECERLVKAITDGVMGDAGNYTAAYAQQLAQAINVVGDRPIPVRIFNWSSENHHLGRADGAIRLIAELDRHGLLSGKRALLWGHSHAGNVFAIASHLLAANREANRAFFDACRVYYQSPIFGSVDQPLWPEVARRLESLPEGAGRALDFVTFGTPIRYEWNPRGHGGLLHFIHHRDLPPVSAKPPAAMLADMLCAAEGDYVQRIGVAGADMPPPLLRWRSRLANRRLRKLLEPSASRNLLAIDLRSTRVVSRSGETLLVDYGRESTTPLHHMLGHAVYTRREWMLFHAEEVARRLYQTTASLPK